jgi:cell division protein FtsI (penicillin-binding protein 3)
MVGHGLGQLVGRGAFRDSAIVGLFLLVMVLIIFRLVDLTIVEAKTLSDKALRQRIAEYTIPAHRGSIFDRNHNVLAISIDSLSIYGRTGQITNREATAEALSKIFGDTKQYYLDILAVGEQPTVVNFYRGIEDLQKKELYNQALRAYDQKARSDYPNATEAEIAALNPLNGIDCVYQEKRVYPYGDVGSQIIGAVDLEGHGRSGLELTYDRILHGVDGKASYERGIYMDESDSQNPVMVETPIPGAVDNSVAAIDGQDIIISIDIELQIEAERQLRSFGESYLTDNANVIMIDAPTGEILCGASLPLYSRANVTTEELENSADSCKAITQSYEPGSVIKSVTAAAALENNTMGTEDVLVVPEFIELGDYQISDSFEHGIMDMSFRDILVHSSNLGISLIADKVGDEKLYEMFSNAGFGSPTRVDYPNDAIGFLPELFAEKWNTGARTTVNYGQGMEATSLQIASYYAAVANYGVMVQPHFLISRSAQKIMPEYSARRLMSEQAAGNLENMLRSVVEVHAPATNIEGQNIVGKTGTANKYDPKTGLIIENEVITTFAGYFADSTSSIACVASYDKQGDYYVPPSQYMFNELMTFTANRYMVVPADAAEQARVAEQAEQQATTGKA